ncbi:MAG: hypothetical protein J0I08_12135 [Rhizobiales bacterium]|nr:hypothetical protein [Hyphomicrobiales bacterium]
MPALRHDYRTTLSAWQPRQPANDNAPISAEDFASLAARRAFIQREQSTPDPVLALPTLERLGRVAPDVVALWKFWRDLQSAPAPDVYAEPEIVHDHAIAGSLRPERGLMAEAEPINSGFSEGGEQDLECRPTVAEIERAMEGAGRVSVVCMVIRGVRSDVRQVRRPCERGANARIGDLVFRNGVMVQWGETARGVPLAPVERLRASKGSRNPKPVRDLRWLVQTDAPIAKNAGFLAGVTASTGRSGAPIECFAEAEQARKAEEQGLRQALGARAEILDLAITDATAREIGERRGYRGKHAERRGIFLVNEAFAALRALVGENILAKVA